MREYLTDLSKTVEDRVAANEYRPSRLLADFYILLGEQRGENVVAERQIGLLYESLLAGETDTLRVRLSIDAGDPDEEEDDTPGDGDGEFELVYAASGNAGGEQVISRSFKIVDTNGVISFGRQLKDASVVSRGTVVLGGNANDFEVGPAVDVRCSRLEVRVTGLVVRASRSSAPNTDGVVLEAGKCESLLLRKPVVRGSLSVRWPGAEAFPWSDYAIQREDDEVSSKQMHEVQRRFRRIAGTMQSHSRGGLARLRDKVEHRRVLRNDIGRALLGRLLADGIIKLEGKFYHWVGERADALLKTSWNDLRHYRHTPELRAYLMKFIGDNQKLF
jgi:hypothetical protein